MKLSLDEILKRDDKKIAILVDPDKVNTAIDIDPLIKKIEALESAIIFVGGSTVDPVDFENCVSAIKAKCDIPVILFPGSSQQISAKADGILFLTLISGRNPDFLIGHQIESAHLIKKMDLEVIPTGYLLVDGGKTSSVSYVSQTTPIPADQITIAVKTAIAGEMLGLKALFMDAGSGADKPVSGEMIAAVKKNISIPLIIGGGLKTIEDIKTALGAGADLVVIGNRIEEDTNFLLDIKSLMKNELFYSLRNMN
ncbi:MAG: phosphoglycerol geranylgeranyltransferase [Crocinitomix sp.]|jgi:phosphoglycerol geranylgeranyltransferase